MNYDSIGNAASKAFGKIDKTLQTDTDLETYSKIKGDMFHILVKQYGQDEVMRYIKEMEFKRMNHRSV